MFVGARKRDFDRKASESCVGRYRAGIGQRRPGPGRLRPPILAPETAQVASTLPELAPNLVAFARICSISPRSWPNSMRSSSSHFEFPGAGMVTKSEMCKSSTTGNLSLTCATTFGPPTAPIP